jgi:hypothetical protein
MPIVAAPLNRLECATIKKALRLGGKFQIRLSSVVGDLDAAAGSNLHMVDQEGRT